MRSAVLKGARVHPREDVKARAGTRLWKGLNARLKSQVGSGHENFLIRRMGSAILLEN